MAHIWQQSPYRINSPLAFNTTVYFQMISLLIACLTLIINPDSIWACDLTVSKNFVFNSQLESQVSQFIFLSFMNNLSLVYQWFMFFILIIFRLNLQGISNNSKFFLHYFYLIYRWIFVCFCHNIHRNYTCP